MKKKINILCEEKFNFYSLLYSKWSILIENIEYFKSNGYEINFYNKEVEGLLDCDILFLSSRFFYKSNFKINTITSTLQRYSKINSNIIWFDLRDSAGTTQFEVLPYVKLYLKGQIYRDLSKYETPFYGGRMYTDYYFNKYNISDTNLYEMSTLKKEYFKKIQVSWNLGVIRFDYLNNLDFFKKIYLRFKGKNEFLKIKEIDYSIKFLEKKYRTFAVFNLKFPRASVAYQRKLALKKLDKINHFNDVFNIKLSKKKYLKKMSSSKYVLSCYGWGEICYRDWEAVTSNSLILKPDMSNIDTWPNLYSSHKTYIPLSWDLSDLEHQIESLEKGIYDLENIKKSAFEIYKSIRSNNCKIFRKRFINILNQV